MFVGSLLYRSAVIGGGVLLFQLAAQPRLVAQDSAASAPPRLNSVVPASSRALDLAITLRASTLGLGGELSKLIGGHMAIRAGANMLNYNRAQAVSGVDYAAQLSFKNYTGLIDLFPSYQGSFHFTGGIVGSTNAVNATGVPTSSGTIDLAGTTYTSAQVGVLTGKLSFPSTGGYAGIGWGSPARRGGRVRLVLDLGAVIGSPTLDLHASQESSNPQLAASVAAQRDKTQSDISRYAKAWPVVSTGLSVHF